MKDGVEAGLERIERHWRWWLLLFWVLVAAYMVYDRQNNIRIFALSHTGAKPGPGANSVPY